MSRVGNSFSISSFKRQLSSRALSDCDGCFRKIGQIVAAHRLHRHIAALDGKVAQYTLQYCPLCDAVAFAATIGSSLMHHLQNVSLIQYLPGRHILAFRKFQLHKRGIVLAKFHPTHAHPLPVISRNPFSLNPSVRRLRF